MQVGSELPGSNPYDVEEDQLYDVYDAAPIFFRAGLSRRQNAEAALRLDDLLHVRLESVFQRQFL